MEEKKLDIVNSTEEKVETLGSTGAELVEELKRKYSQGV